MSCLSKYLSFLNSLQLPSFLSPLHLKLGLLDLFRLPFNPRGAPAYASNDVISVVSVIENDSRLTAHRLFVTGHLLKLTKQDICSHSMYKAESNTEMYKQGQGGTKVHP